MNWLDLVLILILLASILSSFRKGLSREIIGVITVCMAILLGIWFYGSAAGYLQPYLSSQRAANFSGFAVVFCGVLLLGSLFNVVVGRFLRITGLSFLDHLLGAGFGVVRGLLIGVALITGIMAFSQGDRPAESVIHSRMAPYVVGGARVVAAMAPHELKEGFRKSYAKVKSAWSQPNGKG
ncbi:MAG: CvpA family protein [Acidobacteriia bacterium]|nr:CvpA family protein [Terriglobia bacterium]